LGRGSGVEVRVWRYRNLGSTDRRVRPGSKYQRKSQSIRKIIIRRSASSPHQKNDRTKRKREGTPLHAETHLFDRRQYPRFPLVCPIRTYTEVNLGRVLVGYVAGGELEDSVGWGGGGGGGSEHEG
jgi:hypothetical protein